MHTKTNDRARGPSFGGLLLTMLLLLGCSDVLVLIGVSRDPHEGSAGERGVELVQGGHVGHGQRAIGAVLLAAWPVLSEPGDHRGPVALFHRVADG